jgi:hypothetical protein
MEKLPLLPFSEIVIRRYGNEKTNYQRDTAKNAAVSQ